MNSGPSMIIGDQNCIPVIVKILPPTGSSKICMVLISNKNLSNSITLIWWKLHSGNFYASFINFSAICILCKLPFSWQAGLHSCMHCHAKFTLLACTATPWNMMLIHVLVNTCSAGGLGEEGYNNISGLPQCFSSWLFEQSLSPSHTHFFGIQIQFPQEKKWSGHVHDPVDWLSIPAKEIKIFYKMDSKSKPQYICNLDTCSDKNLLQQIDTVWNIKY